MTNLSHPAKASPWDRFGWVMSTVWLVFLAFPLADLWTEPVPMVLRVFGSLAVLAFATLYTASFLRLNWSRGLRPKPGPEPWIVLGILTAIGLLLGWMVGVGSLGLVTYVIAYGMFALPLRTACLHGAGWCLAAIVILIVTDSVGDFWFFIAIPIIVADLTGFVRWMEAGQAVHTQMQQQLTLLGERERVARDVHDVLGHSLTVVTVKAELAGRLIDRDPAAAKAELADIQSMSRQALAEIRATVAGLRVARLEDELAHARSALAGAGIEAEIPAGAEEVDPRHRMVIAWVLREAVTNVVRHSHAKHCRIELSNNRLIVTDDGVGMAPCETSPESGAEQAAVASEAGDSSGSHSSGSDDSNGLRGARERVADAGGTLTVGASSMGGARIEVEL